MTSARNLSQHHLDSLSSRQPLHRPLRSNLAGTPARPNWKTSPHPHRGSSIARLPIKRSVVRSAVQPRPLDSFLVRCHPPPPSRTFHPATALPRRLNVHLQKTTPALPRLASSLAPSRATPRLQQKPTGFHAQLLETTSRPAACLVLLRGAKTATTTRTRILARPPPCLIFRTDLQRLPSHQAAPLIACRRAAPCRSFQARIPRPVSFNSLHPRTAGRAPRHLPSLAAKLEHLNQVFEQIRRSGPPHAHPFQTLPLEASCPPPRVRPTSRLRRPSATRPSRAFPARPRANRSVAPNPTWTCPSVCLPCPTSQTGSTCSTLNSRGSSTRRRTR